MKRIGWVLVVVFLLWQGNAYGQIVKVTTTEGSYNILREYFQHNIRFPSIAKENDVAGEVIVRFIIDRDQRLTDIKLVKGLFANCDSEVVQKVKDYNVYKKGIELKPQKYTVAVNFIIVENNSKGLKDTLNKVAFKKTDTDKLLLIKIVAHATEQRAHKIIDYEIIRSPCSAPDFNQYSGKVKYLTVEKYKADKKGNTYLDSLETKSTQTFDVKGNIIEDIDYDEKGSLTSDKKFQYDENGDRTESDYLPDGKIIYKAFVKFNKVRNIIEYDWIDEQDGSAIRRVTYVYDSKDRLQSSSDDKDVLKYDGKNHLIERENRFSDGSLLSIESFKYNNKNNVIEEAYIGNKLERVSSTFEYSKYDKNGNWRKVVWVNGRTAQTYIVEREITYW